MISSIRFDSFFLFSGIPLIREARLKGEFRFGFPAKYLKAIQIGLSFSEGLNKNYLEFATQDLDHYEPFEILPGMVWHEQLQMPIMPEQ